MKLRATVNRVTGRTRHGIARIDNGHVVESARLPSPEWVEITEQDGLYYLFSFTATLGCIADTCHLTLDEAKAQALAEFDIPTSSWETVE
jgi:hypothetical protein